jgi:PqqD family protein of HPr-rel-A system
MPFRAPASDALLIAELDAFTAIFHRPSGITHLLVSPAPEILAILAGEALSIEALLERLGEDYELADADVASLAARVDELVEAGLLSAA